MNKLLLLILLTSCTDSTSIERIAQLEKELDQCQNGAPKLLSKVSQSIKDKDIVSAEAALELMEQYNHGSIEHKKADSLVSSLRVIIKKENEEREAAELARVEKEKQDREKAIKSAKKQVDDVSGYTYYYNSYFTHYNNSNKTSIYAITHPGKRTSIAIKMSYEGDDWIFFEKAYLSYDGNTHEVSFNKFNDHDSEVGNGGRVWEWIHLIADEKLINYLRDFSKSNDAKMRLSGKYSKTRNLSNQEKQAIQQVLSVYDALS